MDLFCVRVPASIFLASILFALLLLCFQIQLCPQELAFLPQMGNQDMVTGLESGEDDLGLHHES